MAKATKRTGVLKQIPFTGKKEKNSATTAENNTWGTHVQATVHHVKNVAKLIIGNLSVGPPNGNNSTKEESQPSKKLFTQC